MAILNFIIQNLVDIFVIALLIWGVFRAYNWWKIKRSRKKEVEEW